MSPVPFIFRPSPCEGQALLHQVSKGLQARTEWLSRRQYPGLWKQTDRLTGMAKGRTRSRRRTVGMSVVCLALGIFLLVPGLMDPQELLVPLVAGGVAAVAGITGLWRSFRRGRNPFDRSAQTLLQGLESAPEAQMPTVSFDEQGMEIAAPDGEKQTVPWSGFESVVETPDALLLVYGQRVMLLQKKDLTQGEGQQLHEFLTRKIPVISAS